MNIYNLNNLIIICKIKDLERLFDDVWQTVKFKKVYFNKNESFDILIKALTTTDLDELNQSIKSRYFDE
ncbi:hypothetical protein [Methanobrevibacter thaueri]|uniref:hypothetical protein n=1 Tax=Methanobrevibacter thaueri TaxID=190975 RepID=UPI001057D854|nr:hypothetical protein [Methanobrevibacter thaueri]